VGHLVCIQVNASAMHSHIQLEFGSLKCLLCQIIVLNEASSLEILGVGFTGHIFLILLLPLTLWRQLSRHPVLYRISHHL